MPLAARINKPTDAGADPGQLAVPELPCPTRRGGASSDSHVPQSSAEISILHALSHLHSRLEHEQRILHAMRRTTMKSASCKRNQAIPSICVAAGWFLRLLSLGVLMMPVASAQQQDEQQGVDQGNYNIKQSIEFGGRFTSITGDQQTYDTM